MKNLTKVFSTVKEESPILYTIVLIHLFLAIGCAAGLFIDERTVMGINVWIKPLKFAISDGIYIMTVGYLIGFYPYTKRKTNIINNIVAWTLLIETVIVLFQASRGIQSHYNKSSIFDALLFMSMGILIGINVIVMALFIFDTIRLKLKTTKPIQWAILLGWSVVFLGS
jgi:vacuolar-type H+-ATPase subunit I/STV1